MCKFALLKFKKHCIFSIFVGYRLRGPNLFTTHVWDAVDCTNLCLFDQRCTSSINVEEYEGQCAARLSCQLNNRTRISNPNDYVFDHHFHYYEPTLGPLVSSGFPSQNFIPQALILAKTVAVSLQSYNFQKFI